MKQLLDRIFKRGPRSVVFYQLCYYHHYYLAQALRRRGWDALMVSIEDPNGPNANFYHGEDLNLFASTPEEQKKNIQQFFAMAIKRFRMMHFAGDGSLSFFPEYYGDPEPQDLMMWRGKGNKIAYTTSGCNSGIAQSSLMRWSASNPGGPICCNKCPYQGVEIVCSDKKNLAWAQRAEKFCDVIFADGAPALDLLKSPKVFRDPISSCLDPEVWRLDLDIPERHRVRTSADEILIYHSFGNFHLRANAERNVKGTPAIFAAIERLKSEGFPVRLIYVTDVPNIEVRFIQAQADIVVDQLNFGRYGATAKECMMLGKPVICYINPNELYPGKEIPSLRELPLISATEETVYDKLLELVLSEERRRSIGAASRRFAMKWLSADACAERYERVYDSLMSGTLETNRPIFESQDL